MEICHKHGVLFIADEVQSGFGRTGHLFASEYYGIEPDILVTAKSLGDGLPLAAITGRAEIMDAPGPGGLGGTFAGNPLSCAAALAVLDIFERENLLARANELGEHFQKRARQWQKRWPIVGDVRGLGGMQAIELVRSADTREPAAEETKQVTQYCYEHGLITITAGSYSNVVRVLVPLVVTEQQTGRRPGCAGIRAADGVRKEGRHRPAGLDCVTRVVAGDSLSGQPGRACPERSRRAGATIS